MTPAERALANAVPCELILYAYRKNKDGVVVSFVVHPDEMPTELAIAPIGSRWVGALVQVGDDELPVNRKEAMPNKPVSKSITPDARPEPNPPARAKRDWQEIPPQQRAGIRVGEALFAAFLREERPDDWHETGDADGCLKLICAIDSKRELGTNHKALLMFNLLDSAFDAWKVKESVRA